MGVIRWVERWWFGLPRWQLALVVLLIICLRSGVWQIPNMDLSRQIALAPWRNPFGAEPASYLMWNWLGPALAWVVGALSPQAFFAFHLACSLAFYAVVVALLFRRLSDHAARVALLLFAMLPVSGTAFFWVGYDSVTLLLMALIVAAAHRPAWAAALAFLLGLLGRQHGMLAQPVCGPSYPSG